MQAASDATVMERARMEQRVLISADTDFGTLLAQQHAKDPSVLLVGRFVGRRAPEQTAVILANLDDVAEDLTIGAVVVLSDEWARIRRLCCPDPGTGPRLWP